MNCNRASWSVVLYPGASYLHPSGQSPLCITKIQFKEGARLYGDGRSVIKVTYDDSDSDDDDEDDWGCSSSETGVHEVVVAALTPGRIERALTSFVLSDDVEFVSLAVTGANPVELVGHYLLDEEEDEEEAEEAGVDWAYDEFAAASPKKYDELCRYLESVLDQGLLANDPSLLKSAFRIGATPPPSSPYEDYSYSCLNKSPTKFPPGTQFLPGFTPPRSSPPLPAEDTKPLATYDLPAHLRPPTPPNLLAPAPPLPPAPSLDSAGLLAAIKTEESEGEAVWGSAWPSASLEPGSSAIAAAARTGGLGWATQELKPAVRVPVLPAAPLLPLGWGMQAAQASLVPLKRPAEDNWCDSWRKGWAGW